MADLLVWLEAHDALAGWAQFVGAVLAMFVTYFTAFAPTWRRKRQLHDEATRLLMHGYEVMRASTERPHISLHFSYLFVKRH